MTEQKHPTPKDDWLTEDGEFSWAQYASFARLTDKQLRLCQGLVEGRTQVQAAKEAGYYAGRWDEWDDDTRRSKASVLCRNKHVKTAVDAYRAWSGSYAEIVDSEELEKELSKAIRAKPSGWIQAAGLLQKIQEAKAKEKAERRNTADPETVVAVLDGTLCRDCMRKIRTALGMKLEGTYADPRANGGTAVPDKVGLGAEAAVGGNGSRFPGTSAGTGTREGTITVDEDFARDWERSGA